MVGFCMIMCNSASIHLGALIAVVYGTVVAVGIYNPTVVHFSRENPAATEDFPLNTQGNSPAVLCI